MSKKKFSVEWNDHQTAWIRSMSDLRAKNDFADVTLVTDDKVKFSAHKILLSSCSNTLKFILKDIIHPNPLLYLSGINSENFGFVLDYIYCGEVKLLQEQLKGFLESATKLEIEGLFDLDQDITHSDEQKNDHPVLYPPQTFSSLEDDLYKETEDIKPEVTLESDTPTQSRRQYPNDTPSDAVVFNASSMTAEEEDLKRKELYLKVDKAWKCLACNYDSKDRSNMKKHIEKHIDGLSFACTLCNKVFKTKGALRSHMYKGHKKLNC